jgi:hypothetical protein
MHHSNVRQVCFGEAATLPQTEPSVECLSAPADITLFGLSHFYLLLACGKTCLCSPGGCIFCCELLLQSSQLFACLRHLRKMDHHDIVRYVTQKVHKVEQAWGLYKISQVFNTRFAEPM